jgi:hypothetical protein
MEVTDLTALPYEEWLAYIFDHNCDESVLPTERRPWYLDADVHLRIGDPIVLIDYVGRMCREFAYLSQQYALPQLDQGVKFVLSAAGVWFRVYLLDERLPIDSRVACIRSMEIVFSEFLARSTAPLMEHCFYMWWEYLSFEKENRTGDMRQIRQAMFETLVRILAIDDPRCQQAALHGLGHLGHAEGHRVVQEWLDSHRDELEPEGVGWVEQCRDGHVM